MTSTKRERERGAIAVFMALILTIVMGFAALAFDLSYVRLARFEMKNATDAAAHAAMYVLKTERSNASQRTDAINAAIGVAAKNTVLGYAVTLASTDVSIGQWNYGTASFTSDPNVANAVKVRGHTAEPTAPDQMVVTTFANTIGFGTAKVTQTSYGAYRNRSTMFEMDITGSFLQSSCALADAKAADLAFLDDMYNAGIYNDRIGMDVFTGDARPFTAFWQLGSQYNTIKGLWTGDTNAPNLKSHQSGIGACTKLALGTGDYSPCPGGPNVWPNETYLAPGVQNIDCALGDFHYSPTVPNIYGGTNIGAGIKSGIAGLAAANASDIRAIVVFTDGGPMCCEAAAGGAVCGSTVPNVNPCCADGTDPGCVDNRGGSVCQCSRDVAAYGLAQADAAAALGIDVYVLAFGKNPPDAVSTRWFTYAKTLPRGRGFEVDTNDSTQLTAKILQISNSIQIALVK